MILSSLSFPPFQAVCTLLLLLFKLFAPLSLPFLPLPKLFAPLSLPFLPLPKLFALSPPFLPTFQAVCFLSPTPGDGGNDVSMIQAANVGIGIVGKVS